MACEAANPPAKTARRRRVVAVPAARRHRTAHQAAPARSTSPPSGRTPVAWATAKPATKAPAATGQVGGATIPRPPAAPGVRRCCGPVSA
jgi:hypothetical protein